VKTETEQPFDVAIVGAGPAGSSAAIILCRVGLSVVLLEASSFPRPKLCGEFLSPECADWLEPIGIDLHSLGAQPVSRAQFSVPNGLKVEIPFPRPGWGISRATLDAALAQVAVSHGAVLREKTTVTNITGGLENGFCIEVAVGSQESEIRARTVIAAHGRRNALDRALDRPFLRRSHPFVALKRHFYGPRLDSLVSLHAFPGGYCGLAEIEGGMTNACLLVREPVFRSAAKSGGRPIESFVDWMRRQNAYLAEWFAQAEPADERWLAVAQVPFYSKSPTSGDILMAGDAGGLIAPLAGDGIAIALESGAMAAQRCLEFLAGKPDRRGMPALYARDWERTFGSRLRLGRLLQHIMLDPRKAGYALRLVDRVPALGIWLLTHTRDLDVNLAKVRQQVGGKPSQG
jgi:flavin-dependent dehydrogenase